MNALKFIKIVGLDSPRPTQTDNGEFEIFQGITSDATAVTPPPEGGDIPPVDPVPTPLNDAIAEFKEFFDSQMQTMMSTTQQQSRALREGKLDGSRSRGLPAPMQGGMADVFKAIMIFMPNWVTKYYAIADQLAPYVRAVSDAVAVGGAIKDFFVGTDFQNAFLEYAWYDLFGFWPTSKIDKLARDTSLTNINESIQGIGGGNQDLKDIVGALQDLVLKDIEIKFGDGIALRIRAQILHY